MKKSLRKNDFILPKTFQDIAITAEGLGFDSRAGQIQHSVATVAMFLRSCVVQALSRGYGPAQGR